jgi:multidrug efflux pump subunit AcrA (membrane-fusion protein)
MECRRSLAKMFDGWRHRRFALTINPGRPWCVDNRALASVLQRVMIRDGRLRRLVLDIPDRPGVLGEISSRIDAGANKSRQRSSLQRLLAPVDGTVTQLSVHTIGGVVEPTKPIMVIVPKGGTLIGEVKILNKDVGFVKEGQRVAVKLEAFPFTRYGTVPGTLRKHRI